MSYLEQSTQVAAEQHELTLAKHYDTLVQTRESQSTAADLTVNANILHSLRRLSHHLRLLLRSMVGEDSDSETSSSPALDLVTDPSSLSEGIEELQQLVQELSDQTDDEFDNKGRPDWTVQREWEIRRLEEENAMLRKALEIDAENMEARGLEVDAGQIDIHRTMVIANHRAQAENSYWAGVPLETGSHTQRTPDSQFLSRLNIQQQGQPQSPVQSTPQQSQKRATGVWGTSTLPDRRERNNGAGRPLTFTGQTPSALTLWSSQPASPAPPVVEKSWQAPGSSLDLTPGFS